MLVSNSTGHPARWNDKTVALLDHFSVGLDEQVVTELTSQIVNCKNTQNGALSITTGSICAPIEMRTA
jgi:hypothetical protein